GQTVDQCFEKIGYPDWYKGKKGKKQRRMAANVTTGFDDHFSSDTPFDLCNENDIEMHQGGGFDQKLVVVVCQEVMNMFKGKGGESNASREYACTSHAGIFSCCTIFFALFYHPYMNIKKDWVNDTGASDHMKPNFDLFISVTYLKNPIIVHLPDRSSKTITIVGKVQLTPSLVLINVFYVHDFQLNIISMSQLIQNNQLVAHFYPNDCCFQDPSTNQVVVVGKGSRCLYICKPTVDPIAFSTTISEFYVSHLNSFPTTSLSKESFSNSVSKNVLDVQTFHSRLGHSSVSKLLHIPLYKSMDFLEFSCESCMLAKHHRLSFPKSDGLSSSPFHLIHVDLWGPYKQAVLNGVHYFFNIVDDNTRSTWIYLVHSKEQIPSLLLSVFAYVKTHFQRQPKVVRSDNGTEIVNKTCVEFFQTHGVVHQKSMAYTLQQNGRKSPYEKLYDKPPIYDHLRIIGCLCYAANVKPHKDKFENRGVKCVLIGYPVIQKGYKLYKWDTNEIFRIRDMVFEEHVFPYPVFDTHPLEETVIPNTPLPETTPTVNLVFTKPAVEHVAELDQSYQMPFTSASMPVRKSTKSKTRPAWLQDFVTPAKVNSSFLANVFAIPEPTSYKQAIQHKGWVKAMEVELAALERNETWTVTSLPARHKPITSKWVFKTKYQPNVLITLAIAKQFPLHQLDINNAFLHGYIDEEIYMVPPEGYTKALKGQVCKLNKSLYGLKQASRQWNHELTKFLISIRYVQSKHDYSLFVKTQGEDFTTVLVYVDDMLIIVNS
ncbi:putative RNA-directed DNA polymerase, partial [Tanacetum coccineum]